jgi:hypothetical protein
VNEDAENYMLADEATPTTPVDLVALARAWQNARHVLSLEREIEPFPGTAAQLASADATAALLLQLDASQQKASSALAPRWAALARFADAAGAALAVPLDGAELDAALKSAFGAFVDEIGGLP